MAHVVLVYPRGGFAPRSPPLGVLHLAAMLRQADLSVAVIDASIDAGYRERLVDAVDGDTLCVGVSAMTGPQIAGGLEVAEVVRRLRPGLPVVWGGVHPQLVPEQTLADDRVDIVCTGDGELALPALASCLARGGDLASVAGVAWKRDGRLTINPPAPQFDLDALPLIPYELLGLDSYRMTPDHSFFKFTTPRVATLELSRGCPYRCSYCVHNVLRTRFRHMSTDRALAHLEHIARLGYGGVIITDDVFFTDLRWARATLEELRTRGPRLELYMSIRVDRLAAMSDDDLGLLRAAGVTCLGVSVESGSDDMLESIVKKQTVEQAYEANRRIRGHQIVPSYNFITGYPDETLADAIATYEMMIRLLAENPRARANNKRLVPLPKTLALRQSVAKGMVEPASLEEWGRSLDLEWTEPAPHVDPAVEAWFQSTRYFNSFITLLSQRRNNAATLVDRARLEVVELAFPLIAAQIRARARLRWPHPGPDTRLWGAAAQVARRLRDGAGAARRRRITRSRARP